MNLDEILRSLNSKKISVKEAKKLLSLYSLEKIEDFAKIDINREKRTGIPEVIFAQPKQLSEIKEIIKKVIEKTDSLVVSRINKKDYNEILEFVQGLSVGIKTGKKCSTILIHKKPIRTEKGKIGIITAGTSDIGIAEEARLMSTAMSCDCICSYDVGVAGIQRIFPILKKMIQEDVDCIIVAAGMEGALATLVASLVDVPVIGIPTSVGYGYGEKGIAALASMLQSCSLGLSVVNIDNGIAAGAVAGNIANRVNQKNTSNKQIS